MRRHCFLLLVIVALVAPQGNLVAGGQPEQRTAQSISRLIVAMDTPAVETTRFWTTPVGWGLLSPSLEGLIGNDPVTNAFTNTGLAESWSHNENFTEWTFRLHQGVQFHFGYGEVTAADVVHSYNLHTSADSVTPDVGQLRGGEVTALDRYTVLFRYPTPRVNFEFFTATARGSLYIYSKVQFDREGLEGYDRKFAGTGPYEFVERSPGRMLYRSVESHRSGVTPDFPEIEFKFIGEASTKLAMLAAGEAHIALLPRELHGDASRRGLSLIQSQQPSMQTVLGFNGLYCTTGDTACRPDLPWADVRIREAINRAINRQEMLEVLFPGGGAEIVRGAYAMYHLHEGYDAALEARTEADYGYSPDRARALMREAGYPGAFPDPTIPLILTNPPGQPEIPVQMELIQSYLQAVGFRAEIREIDHAAVGALGRAREAYFLNPIRNLPIRPTEPSFRAFYTTSGGPYMGYEDDFMQTTITEYVNSTNAQRRDELARRVFNYAFDNYVSIPLFEVYSFVVADPAVVADWTFPGTGGSVLTHWELVKAARR